jgi:Contractile injection system tube protein
MRNPEAVQKLKTATYGKATAALVEYKKDAELTAPKLYIFLFNPSSLQFSRSAKYSETATWGQKKQDYQYYMTTGRTLKLPGLVLESWYIGKTIKPLLNGLESLMEADISKNIYNPPILSFVWGKNWFGPCVISELSWDEKGWLNGMPANATMNLTLLELPEPVRKTDALAPKPKSVDDDPKELTPKAGEKLRNPLTDRQMKEASAEAEKWLQANKDKCSDVVKGMLKNKSYFLLTEKTTGVVAFLDKSKQLIGNVGQWDGTILLTDPQNTIPKKEDKPTKKEEPVKKDGAVKK